MESQTLKVQDRRGNPLLGEPHILRILCVPEGLIDVNAAVVGNFLIVHQPRPTINQEKRLECQHLSMSIIIHFHILAAPSLYFEYTNFAFRLFISYA